MAASATAAFMHLAALAREAQERHPCAGSPHQNSAEDPNTLTAKAGLMWVADGAGAWANQELLVLDGALATSISHAAVNLRTLVGLVLENTSPEAGRGTWMRPGRCSA